MLKKIAMIALIFIATNAHGVVSKHGQVCKWLKHADCKSAIREGYIGSNPILSN